MKEFPEHSPESLQPKASPNFADGAMPPTPILDLSAIQTLRELGAPGGPDPVHELIDLFLSDAPRIIEQIVAAFRNRDLSGIDHGTHMLKGSSSSLGAKRLALACSSVSDLVRGGEFPTAEHINAIESEFESLRPELVAAKNARSC